MKTIFILTALVICSVHPAQAICTSMSESKAQLAVNLINAQVQKNSAKLGTIDTAVTFKNIKSAKLIKTETGYSQVGLITTYSTAERPYSIIDLGNSYLKLEGTNNAINLGYLTACNIEDIQKIGYQVVREIY